MNSLNLQPRLLQLGQRPTFQMESASFHAPLGVSTTRWGELRGMNAHPEFANFGPVIGSFVPDTARANPSRWNWKWESLHFLQSEGFDKG